MKATGVLYLLVGLAACRGGEPVSTPGAAPGSTYAPPSYGYDPPAPKPRASATPKAFEPAPPSKTCEAIYAGGYKPYTTKDVVQVPAMKQPVRGVPYADPTYKTCVVRVTDFKADGVDGFARHEYSRRQAFNADNSKILVTAHDGSWWLYDANAFKPIRKLDGVGGDAEPHWHATDPDIFYYLPNMGIGMKLYEMNVATNRSRVVTDFTERLTKLWPGAKSCWTHDYGSPSADSRYFAFEVADKDWNGLGVFTYDREKDKIIGTQSVPKGSPQPLPTMTLSGKYVLVSWGKDGGATDRFTLDFKNRMQVVPKIEHADLGIDANGHDTYVSIDFDADGGPIYMVDVETGKRTDLIRTYVDGSTTSAHFSGKAFRRPGWVLISTFEEVGARQWFHGNLMAVELKANPRVVRLAHHHSARHGYWAEPHGSVNRDFTRVVFNSNWDKKTDDMDTYMIEIPKTALE